MTFRVLLDGVIHEPVADVLVGRLTPQACDVRYRGTVGLCPDCEALMADPDFAATVGDKDRTIIYHRGSYDSNGNLVRAMHFEHRAGYLQGDDAPCSDGSKYLHDLVLGMLLQRHLQMSPLDCTGHLDPSLGDHRPDICIFDLEGQSHTCVEYQRSPESFGSFLKRHIQRESEWKHVIWYWDESVYNRAGIKLARHYLAARGIPFYRCSLDRSGLKLQIEDGSAPPTPAPREVKYALEDAEERACRRSSTASPTTRKSTRRTARNAGSTLNTKKRPPAKIGPQTGMDWTAILARAGIPEPPGREEVIKALKQEYEDKFGTSA